MPKFSTVQPNKRFNQTRGTKLPRRLTAMLFQKVDVNNYFIQKKITMIEVILYHGEDGYWVTEGSSLPGCISQGETKKLSKI